MKRWIEYGCDELPNPSGPVTVTLSGQAGVRSGPGRPGQAQELTGAPGTQAPSSFSGSPPLEWRPPR